MLLVVIDTLRADHLGAWGYPVETSPRLDALAAAGVRFHHFFSNSPWTRPSMASLLTGHYPRTTGVYEEKFDALADSLTTLAERLLARGYLTLGVTANPNINAWFGFDQGFDRYGDSGLEWKWIVGDAAAGDPEAPPGERSQAVDATSTTNQVLAALAAQASRLERSPFYLQVLYIDPHRPYRPPPRHRDAVRRASRFPSYDGEIRYVDAEIGRLLDGLRAQGLLEDTLVAVTADHGEGLGDHPSVPFSATHGSTLYDSVLHVPLIIWHPDLPRGRVVEELASSVDLLPTIMDLLGWPIPAGEVAGHSLASLIRGEGPAPELPEVVVAETDWRITSKVSVRSATRRYVRNDDCLAYQQEHAFEGRALDERQRTFLRIPPVELDDVQGDAPEDPASRGLFEREPEVAASLAGELERWERRAPARPPLRRSAEDVFTRGDGTVVPAVPAEAAGRQRPGPGLSEQLRALGYLGEPGEAAVTEPRVPPRD